jgi:hypothetical protein
MVITPETAETPEGGHSEPVEEAFTAISVIIDPSTGLG